MEKQVLLNQAATAFKLYEKQKTATQEQYQQLLEAEREKVAKLERGKYQFILFILGFSRPESKYIEKFRIRS